ncbi:hypothetical protein ACFW64_25780 [Streptomyces albidoflavus]|uniref:hypothetical protein n=1 Tax=Streptomyces albidoflavus TaxID=1886 RepID=UPI0035D5F6F1
MFEIRVICDPADEDRVLSALGGAFTLGPARNYPSRDGRQRLYLTAHHAERWPTPGETYEGAEPILDALDAVTAIAADAECYTALGREYYLRKAAVLDRIALGPDADARDTIAAEDAAQQLIAMDRATAPADPRAYVRREYLAWRSGVPNVGLRRAHP